MKYFFLAISLALLSFFFYKGLEKDPSIIYKYFVSKEDIDLQTERADIFYEILKGYNIDLSKKGNVRRFYKRVKKDFKHYGFAFEALYFKC